MQTPSSQLTTLRPELRSFEEFSTEMDRQGFIGLQVLPVIEVAKASGTFGKIPLKELLKHPDTARAPGSGYTRGAFKFDKDTFATEEHGFEFPVDDKEAKLYGDYFNAEQVAAEQCYDAVLRAQEARTASLIFNTTTWTGASLTTAVGTPWSTAASATPVANIEAACQKVWANSGKWPNTLILTRLSFRALRICDDITARIKYSGFDDPKARGITASVLGQVFDIERVLVADSIKNTADEGQTEVVASMWDKTMAMVAFIQGGPNIKAPTLGRTFHWGEDGSTIGGSIESYREEQTRSEIIRVRHEVQEKVLRKEFAHLLTSVL